MKSVTPSTLINVEPVHIDRHRVRKILVIKLRAIGDVILSTIVLKNLRAAFPNAVIHFLTEKASTPIVHDNPEIDDVVMFHLPTTGSWKFLRQLRAKQYDLVIDLFCNPRSAFMTFFSGARYRVGYPFRGRSYAYNILVPKRKEIAHNVEFNLDALRRIAVPIVDRSISLSVDPEASARMKEFLSPFIASEKPLVILNPHCTRETNKWGLEHFAELGDAITEKLGYQIIIIWGPGEYDDAIRVKGLMRNEAIITPQTSVKDLIALISLCDFIITNDSGPKHIAAAVGTASLGINGPTNPFMQGAYSENSAWVRMDELDCIACNLTKCKIGNICMTNLSVERVFAAFEKLVHRQPHIHESEQR